MDNEVRNKNADKPWLFKPGNKLATGRPKGTRSNLSKAFIEALSKEFDENKDMIIAELRRNPVKYCEILAKLVPQQIQEVKEDPLEDMSEKEIEDFMKNAKKRLKEIDDEE